MPVAHYKFGKYSRKWAYHDIEGRLLGYVCRFDREGKDKEVLPLTYCRSNTGNTDWCYRSFAAPRPLYGLPRLRRNPNNKVLLVEGEKCADAADGVLGTIPVLSWPGGSKAVKKADFSPLKDRNVVLWPDNDEPGISAMQAVYEQIRDIAKSVKFIVLPKGKNSGWDVADAVKSGFGRSNIIDFMVHNVGNPEDIEAEKPKNFNLTDLGNAQRLLHNFGNVLRYNEDPFGKWFWWDDRRWQVDRTNKIYDYVDKLVALMHANAATERDPDKRKALGKCAYNLESMARQKALVNKAETLQANVITTEMIDQNNYKFNVLNCTIDLSSGEPESKDHEQHDYITKIAEVMYDPEAKCPRWKSFLDDIFEGNIELITFVQRAIGYSLTGDVSEQCLFFAYGTGKNGKSVFFETMKLLFGDYAGKAPTEMIMQQYNQAVPTDVADLQGKRFVITSEIEENKRLAEARVKDLTGGDTITARRMRENFFTFQPTHKLWIYGHHKPVLTGTDEGIRRRIKMIPFTVMISEEKRVPMVELLGQFKKEMSGILNWALEGYVRFCEVGFNEPDIMIEAVTDYFAEMDLIGQFISECCVVMRDVSSQTKKLWEKYHGWCDDRGERAVTHRRMNTSLRERGFEICPGTANISTIFGLTISPSEEDSAPEYD